jgi:hypothetical protein
MPRILAAGSKGIVLAAVRQTCYERTEVRRLLSIVSSVAIHPTSTGLYPHGAGKLGVVINEQDATTLAQSAP